MGKNDYPFRYQHIRIDALSGHIRIRSSDSMSVMVTCWHFYFVLLYGSKFLFILQNWYGRMCFIWHSFWQYEHWSNMISTSLFPLRISRNSRPFRFLFEFWLMCQFLFLNNSDEVFYSWIDCVWRNKTTFCELVFIYFSNQLIQ